MKSWRQAQILELIDREAMSSQEVLRRKLKERGIDATQATLSRDLKDLGLVKRAGDGAYVRPGADRGTEVIGEQLHKAVSQLVRGIERVDQLLVTRTDAGQAQGLAVLMDRAKLTEVAGTLAGDDTILIVCRGVDAAQAMERTLNEMVKG
jgi:transcriptional regulator of arginine metabolism